MLKKIKNSDNGVVGIVVAVLLIGLMVSVVSLVQMVYVPKWMEQREAEHMDEVTAQFSQLKFAIGTQYATKQKYTPLATSITLGSKELPYLMSIRAFGHLEILSNTYSKAFSITITNATDSPQYSIGTIKYSSNNAYYVNQDFIYEAGAIITSQTDGDIMSIKPSFPSFETDVNNINISFDLINISGVGGKLSWSGYGTTAIQTEYSGPQIKQNFTNVSSIEIISNYPNSWFFFMNWTLQKQGFTHGNTINTGDFYIETDFPNNKITINIYKRIYYNTNDWYRPTVYINIIEILAQIGPGWIE
jgi:hypothetical protein